MKAETTTVRVRTATRDAITAAAAAEQTTADAVITAGLEALEVERLRRRMERDARRLAADEQDRAHIATIVEEWTAP